MRTNFVVQLHKCKKKYALIIKINIYINEYTVLSSIHYFNIMHISYTILIQKVSIVVWSWEFETLPPPPKIG